MREYPKDVDTADKRYKRSIERWFDASEELVTGRMLPDKKRGYIVNLTDTVHNGGTGSNFGYLVFWCTFNCNGKFNWCGSTTNFYFIFELEDDASLFKLTWY